MQQYTSIVGVSAQDRVCDCASRKKAFGEAAECDRLAAHSTVAQGRLCARQKQRFGASRRELQAGLALQAGSPFDYAQGKTLCSPELHRAALAFGLSAALADQAPVFLH